MDLGFMAAPSGRALLWMKSAVAMERFCLFVAVPGYSPLMSPVEAEDKSSQVNTLPKAKSKTRSKQNKDMHKCSSVYSERGVPLPVLTSGGE